jgi:hypothetical protein
MFVKMQTQYRSKGFEVIGIDAGNNEGAASTDREIKIISDRLSINYYLAHATQPLIDLIDSLSKQQAVPTTILLDRSGQVGGVYEGQSESVDRQITESVKAAMAETN